MVYDVGVIGGGPAGYTAAECAGLAGLRVILFEKGALGGVCLNEGCIPTKALLYSAKLYELGKLGGKYGVGVEGLSLDWGKMLLRKERVVRRLRAGVGARLSGAGVSVVEGLATIAGVDGLGGLRIVCGGKEYTVGKLIVCSGSEASVPAVAGLEARGYWTSGEALLARSVPESLTIIGGGAIGMEFASLFNSMGTSVQVVEMAGEILPGMDRELCGMLREEYARRGVQFYTGYKVVEVGGGELQIENAGGERAVLRSERIMVATGRRAVTAGLGLERVGVVCGGGGGIAVNEWMQTSCANVYACGDATGYSMLAHTAISEAVTAVRHILGEAGRPMSYKAIPSVVYTHPELAGVGWTEEGLSEAGTGYAVKRRSMACSGRFVAENEGGNGVCKLLVGEDGVLLGAHLLGNPASELIVIGGMAIEQGMKVGELGSFVFPHPTVGEILKGI